MKLFALTNILTFIFSLAAYGQKPNKKLANEIVEQSFKCLKTNDSIGFVGLWHIDGKPAPFYDKPFTETSIILIFHYLREFLDSAVTYNLTIDKIKIQKLKPWTNACDCGTHKIVAKIRYGKKYFRGFGFFMDYINGSWKILYYPEMIVNIDGSTITQIRRH